MTPAARIVPLDQQAMAGHATALAALDRDLLMELTTAYSHEPWGEQQFLKDLPGKWRHSCVALERVAPVGFWIAWARGRDLHTSRVGVARGSRHGGLGRQLFQFVLAAACRSQRRWITLTVASANRGALDFYRDLGFTRLAGADLAAFVADTGRSSVVREEEIEEMQNGVGYRYVVCRFDLEGRCA